MSRHSNIIVGDLFMGKIIDLTGQRFGRLVALALVPKEIKHDTTRQAFWLCQCDCGNKHISGSKSLRNGDTRSCGCITKERLTKHGGYGTRLYGIFDKMKSRCNNINSKDYKNYGGRGIKVCDEWQDDTNGFINFYNWAINNGYQDNLSIDRINNDGNYEPDNCRWTDAVTQSNNRRTSKFITYNGETKTITQWSKSTGIGQTVIAQRLKRGWTIEETLTISPVGHHRKCK